MSQSELQKECLSYHKKLLESQQECQLLKESLSQHRKYKDFYDLAFPIVEILEPTPDLKEEVAKIPNLHKLLLVEYIDEVTRKIIRTAM